MNKELIERVEKNQSNFTYRRIFKNKEAEMWECKDPDTINLAFIISISKYGISVCGDMVPPLIFQVGISYGMSFLAGRDVDYYIYSKLYRESREEVLDEQSFQRHIIERVVSRIEVLHEGFFDRINRRFKNLDGAKDYLTALCNRMYRRIFKRHGDYDLWSDFNDIFEYFPYPENLVRAFDKLSELSKVLDDPDYWETQITKPDPGVMFSLYMVNYAAKKILGIPDGRE